MKRRRENKLEEARAFLLSSYFAKKQGPLTLLPETATIAFFLSLSLPYLCFPGGGKGGGIESNQTTTKSVIFLSFFILVPWEKGLRPN
jgi:hypothetical protein